MKTSIQEPREMEREKMMAEDVFAAIRFLLSPNITEFLERDQDSLKKNYGRVVFGNARSEDGDLFGVDFSFLGASAKPSLLPRNS
ncbi:MAG: hypothetical protein HYS17_06200 [Micavibrio aeruginosavorus]|uniref:Uncharacterized protein n=1 Tax=Micavibrio aeruginosavorus TaxID=349221 RepID=A0A7T5R085_9BACT|nr:MAG: hypothetical protein HYS17_06200 [Micavibrio aeruginosavorus]